MLAASRLLRSNLRREPGRWPRVFPSMHNAPEEESQLRFAVSGPHSPSKVGNARAPMRPVVPALRKTSATPGTCPAGLTAPCQRNFRCNREFQTHPHYGHSRGRVLANLLTLAKRTGGVKQMFVFRCKLNQFSDRLWVCRAVLPAGRQLPDGAAAANPVQIWVYCAVLPAGRQPPEVAAGAIPRRYLRPLNPVLNMVRSEPSNSSLFRSAGAAGGGWGLGASLRESNLDHSFDGG